MMNNFILVESNYGKPLIEYGSFAPQINYERFPQGQAGVQYESTDAILN